MQHLLQKTSPGQPDAVRHISEMFFSQESCFESPSQKKTIRTGGLQRYPLLRTLFQRLSFQTHLNAMRTLLPLLWFQVGLSKSLH